MNTCRTLQKQLQMNTTNKDNTNSKMPTQNKGLPPANTSALKVCKLFWWTPCNSWHPKDYSVSNPCCSYNCTGILPYTTKLNYTSSMYVSMVFPRPSRILSIENTSLSNSVQPFQSHATFFWCRQVIVMQGLRLENSGALVLRTGAGARIAPIKSTDARADCLSLHQKLKEFLHKSLAGINRH